MKALVSAIERIGEYVVIKNYETNIKSYKDYYKHLKCDVFDVVRVMWGKHDISIYVDDEGLLKSGVYGRKVKGYSQPLFGNFVITGGVDEEGNTLPIPDEINLEHYIGDINYITKGM